MDVRGTQFDLAGVLRLGLDDSDPVTQRLVGGELDPYPPAQALVATDLVLEDTRGQLLKLRHAQ
jgi:hypothetical protein